MCNIQIWKFKARKCRTIKIEAGGRLYSIRNFSFSFFLKTREGEIYISPWNSWIFLRFLRLEELMSSLDGWVLRLTSIFTCLNPVTNTNRCTPRRYIFLFPSLFLIACARERRLLPHDRIENGRGLRRCLNTRARARLIKCQKRTFLTAQFTRKAEKKKETKHTRAVLELSFFFCFVSFRDDYNNTNR